MISDSPNPNVRLFTDFDPNPESGSVFGVHLADRGPSHQSRTLPSSMLSPTLDREIHTEIPRACLGEEIMRGLGE